MAKRKPSPRQQEILDLLNRDPSLKAGDIAKALKTSEGAVYQQISRLRSAKLLPKTKKGSARPRLSEPKQATGTSTGSVTITNNNGHAPGLSLEDHLNQELTDVVSRIEAIARERADLEAETQERLNGYEQEEADLSGRREQLDKAQEALTA